MEMFSKWMCKTTKSSTKQVDDFESDILENEPDLNPANTTVDNYQDKEEDNMAEFDLQPDPPPKKESKLSIVDCKKSKVKESGEKNKKCKKKNNTRNKTKCNKNKSSSQSSKKCRAPSLKRCKEKLPKQCSSRKRKCKKPSPLNTQTIGACKNPCKTRSKKCSENGNVKTETPRKLRNKKRIDNNVNESCKPAKKIRSKKNAKITKSSNNETDITNSPINIPSPPIVECPPKMSVIPPTSVNSDNDNIEYFQQSSKASSKCDRNPRTRKSILKNQTKNFTSKLSEVSSASINSSILMNKIDEFMRKKQDLDNLKNNPPMMQAQNIKPDICTPPKNPCGSSYKHPSSSKNNVLRSKSNSKSRNSSKVCKKRKQSCKKSPIKSKKCRTMSNTRSTISTKSKYRKMSKSCNRSVISTKPNSRQISKARNQSIISNKSKGRKMYKACKRNAVSAKSKSKKNKNQVSKMKKVGTKKVCIKRNQSKKIPLSKKTLSRTKNRAISKKVKCKVKTRLIKIKKKVKSESETIKPVQSVEVNSQKPSEANTSIVAATSIQPPTQPSNIYPTNVPNMENKPFACIQPPTQPSNIHSTNVPNMENKPFTCHLPHIITGCHGCNETRYLDEQLVQKNKYINTLKKLKTLQRRNKDKEAIPEKKNECDDIPKQFTINIHTERKEPVVTCGSNSSRQHISKTSSDRINNIGSASKEYRKERIRDDNQSDKQCSDVSSESSSKDEVIPRPSMRKSQKIKQSQNSKLYSPKNENQTSEQFRRETITSSPTPDEFQHKLSCYPAYERNGMDRVRISRNETNTSAKPLLRNSTYQSNATGYNASNMRESKGGPDQNASEKLYRNETITSVAKPDNLQHHLLRNSTYRSNVIGHDASQMRESRIGQDENASDKLYRNETITSVAKPDNLQHHLLRNSTYRSNVIGHDASQMRESRIGQDENASDKLYRNETIISVTRPNNLQHHLLRNSTYQRNETGQNVPQLSEPRVRIEENPSNKMYRHDTIVSSPNHGNLRSLHQVSLHQPSIQMSEMRKDPSNLYEKRTTGISGSTPYVQLCTPSNQSAQQRISNCTPLSLMSQQTHNVQLANVQSVNTSNVPAPQSPVSQPYISVPSYVTSQQPVQVPVNYIAQPLSTPIAKIQSTSQSPRYSSDQSQAFSRHSTLNCRQPQVTSVSPPSPQAISHYSTNQSTVYPSTNTILKPTLPVYPTAVQSIPHPQPINPLNSSPTIQTPIFTSDSSDQEMKRKGCISQRTKLRERSRRDKEKHRYRSRNVRNAREMRHTSSYNDRADDEMSTSRVYDGGSGCSEGEFKGGGGGRSRRRSQGCSSRRIRKRSFEGGSCCRGSGGYCSNDCGGSNGRSSCTGGKRKCSDDYRESESSGIVCFGVEHGCNGRKNRSVRRDKKDSISSEQHRSSGEEVVTRKNTPIVKTSDRENSVKNIKRESIDSEKKTSRSSNDKYNIDDANKTSNQLKRGTLSNDTKNGGFKSANSMLSNKRNSVNSDKEKLNTKSNRSDYKASQVICEQIRRADERIQRRSKLSNGARYTVKPNVTSYKSLAASNNDSRHSKQASPRACPKKSAGEDELPTVTYAKSKKTAVESTEKLVDSCTSN